MDFTQRPADIHPVKARAIVLSALAVSATMLALDLAWLGLVAASLYGSLLGPLKRVEVYWPAALLFYAVYVAVIVFYAVFGSSDVRSALRRGGGLGFICYATYELTNWAVIEGWPATLVPIDIAWGVALTAIAAIAGRFAYERASGSKT